MVVVVPIERAKEPAAVCGAWNWEMDCALRPSGCHRNENIMPALGNRHPSPANGGNHLLPTGTCGRTVVKVGHSLATGGTDLPAARMNRQCQFHVPAYFQLIIVPSLALVVERTDGAVLRATREVSVKGLRSLVLWLVRTFYCHRFGIRDQSG